MEDLNEYFKKGKEVSERVAEEFLKINREAKQRLQEINQRIGNVQHVSLEEAIVTTGMNEVNAWELGKAIQSSMEGWDVQAPNREKLNSIESEETQKIVTNAMLDERIIELCKEKSVKPGAKVKKKAKKKYLNVVGYIAAGVVIGIAATPVAAHAINTSYPNQMIEEASQDYTENIFTPNTEKFYNQDKMDTDHYHDLIDIMIETKEEYENPIVGFYLIYNNLDKHCKNHKLEEILYNFNLVYQTDYTSIEDFLQKNNFKNMNEFKEYVGLQLSKLSEEERGRGM